MQWGFFIAVICAKWGVPCSYDRRLTHVKLDKVHDTIRRAAQPLWRTKKSHFQASVEMGMKNVDKDAVNTTIGLLCYLDA